MTGQILIHAQSRCMERCGFVLGHDEINGLILDITDTVLGARSAAIMLRRMPPDELGRPFVREIWAVHLRGIAARIVWQPETASVVTVLGWL